MDKPSADCRSSAKRRCLNNRDSDTLFVSKSPEPNVLNAPNARKQDSTVDDISDGDDDVSEFDDPVYDESDEPFPACPAFDPAINDIRVKSQASVKTLDSVLEQYVSVNKDLENMKAKTAEASKPPKSIRRRKRVALVGPTGAGKSSVINSITDTPGLAKGWLAGGESCTSVPMLYAHKLQGQTKPFAAKVIYTSLKECRCILKHQLKNYNRHTFNFDEEWTTEEANEYLQEADTARAVFQTLFCDKAPFESPRSTTATLLKNHKLGNSTKLLDLMMSWYMERLRGKAEENNASYTFCEGSTVAEFHQALDPLITPRHGYAAPSLWPLVSEVVVGVPSSRVLRSLNIVDLPGITDTNKFRVSATLSHIRSCQALWYVVPVERPCTDPQLEYAISCYAERFPGTFAVVVTKIDRDVTDALAHDMRTKGVSIGDFDLRKASIAELRKRLKVVHNKMMRKTCPLAQKNALWAEEGKLETSLDELNSKQLECVVAARNTYITNRLKYDKAQYLPEGAELPVYCISNEHYAVHKGDAPKNGALLDVEFTGIPALRAYALSFAAPQFWDAHKETLVHKLKVLFHGVHGWAQSSPVNHNRGLPDVVKTVEDLWKVISEASVDRCINDFASKIVESLRTKQATSFAATIRYLHKIRFDWNSLTFLAFFRHGGRHRTCAVGAHSWNEAFIEWQTIKVLDPAWESLPAPEESFGEGVEKLIKALEDIPDQLENLPESVPVSVEAFRNMLSGQVALIRANHETSMSDYKQTYGNIKLDACRDQPTGYFRQAMKPCYRAGKDDSGKGVCAHQKDLLSNHINRQNPLGKANDRLEVALKGTARAQAGNLRSGVGALLEDIDQQYKRILHRESETAEESEARSKIGEVLSHIMPDIDRIELDLKEIEQKYSGALV